jgi:hypothetical protein
MMPDVLIRGLSAAAIERIDAEAEALGLSRNEYLRRRFETSAPKPAESRISMKDLRRATRAARDLADPDVMDAAWR